MTDLISRADAIEAVHEYFRARLAESDGEWNDELQEYVFSKEDKRLLEYNKGVNTALNALPSANVVSREEYNELLRTKISFANATIPTFTESAEEYKAWTGEEMGRPHGRLIDADRLLNEVTDAYDSYSVSDAINKVCGMIINAPTVSADKPHGEWEHTEEVTTMDGLHWHVWRCTNCNRSGNPDMNYCPNCGAKMGGDE